MIKESPEFNQQMTALDEKRADLYKQSSWIFPLTVITPILVTMMAFAVAPEAAIFSGALCVAFAFMIYYVAIGSPFNDLKHKVREFLLQEFMNIYHPNISYRYQPEKDRVKEIIKSSGLVSCNQYHEEDVINGTSNNINF